MNFQDYINASQMNESHNDDLHESEHLNEAADKPKLVHVRSLTLEQFEGALATSCVLYGEDAYVKPLAIKVTSKGVNFVWYDYDEDSYCISDYTAKYGPGDIPHESDIPTLAEAKRMLK